MEWLEAKVVQDEQVRAEIGLEAFAQRAIGATAVDVPEHAVGVDEEGGETLTTRFVGQGLREMGLAYAGRPADEQVALLADVGAGGQVERADTASAPRVIFGRSLGGAVAIDLATRVEADALIVESTFTSIHTIARLLFPLPLPALPVEYDSLSKIERLKLPLLVIHGERDELIPFAEGQALFEAAPEPKSWYPIPCAGHNDTYRVGGDDYFHRLATLVVDLPDG